MLGDISVAENIYIACGYTDMRKSIDGLASIVQQQFHLDPFSNCDETPVQVLKEHGKKPQTKSYMCLYRSGNDGNPPIILYDYQSSRNGDHAVNYLKDFKGYVHSDDTLDTTN